MAPKKAAPVRAAEKAVAEVKKTVRSAPRKAKVAADKVVEAVKDAVQA